MSPPPSRHVMETEDTFPHGWMVQCPTCPRRVFFNRGGGMEVVDTGDFYALHSWMSVPGLALTAEVSNE